MADSTKFNCMNYVGELFMIGANKTPFLNMIGGLDGANSKVVGSFQFPVAQPWALEAASQPDISENDSLTAPTTVNYVRSQDSNTCQMYQRKVSVSYAKQSTVGELAGLSIEGSQPVRDEKDFQIEANLKQISKNVDYTFLNGTYQTDSDTNTSARTRGIVTATATNAVAGGAAALSQTMIDELLRDMANNGAIFEQPVLFCNAFQKQKITSIYAYAPESRTVGGVAIEAIRTDFTDNLGVVWAPNVPTDTILIAEMSVCSPVFLPVKDKGYLFYEELSKTGASEEGQLYGQIGLDYGPEEYHGKITGLATS
jgi:hypothetical protein